MSSLGNDNYRWLLRETAFDGVRAYSWKFEDADMSGEGIQTAKKYAESWDEMQQKNRGLLFCGPVGTGKSFAAGCIANELIERPYPVKVRMTNLPSVLNHITGCSGEDRIKYLDEIMKADLLILDDFGVERGTEFAKEQIFNLIDQRSRFMKPLIVTTNLSVSDLCSVKDMVAERICSRILEMCVPVVFDGADRRKEIARQNQKRFMQELRKGACE